MIDSQMNSYLDVIDRLTTERDTARAQVARFVSALKTIGMHQYFIDAILAGPGAAPATKEQSND